MSQTTLAAFLEFKDPKPEQYDFKCEMPEYYNHYENNWKHSLKYRGMLEILKEEQDTFSGKGDPVRRYQLYKILGNCGANFDCDNSNGTCDLTGEIYEQLWGASKNGRWGTFDVSEFSGLWGGDTMNSFDTIYRYIVEKSANDPELKKTLEEEYSSIYTTLGNFVLVPYGFNGARYNATKDYWDKSLEYLCENGYENHKTSKTSGYFNKKNFDKYVNTFFLWDYTEVTESKYNARKLFDKKDLKNFLNNTINRIKRRGIFMVAMLRISQKNEDDFKKIMEYLSQANKLFNSIEDVLCQICKDSEGQLSLGSDSKEIIKDAKEQIEKI